MRRSPLEEGKRRLERRQALSHARQFVERIAALVAEGRPAAN